MKNRYFKFLYIVIFTVIFTASSFCQRVLITPDSVCRYFPGTTNPGADWFMPDFDDSSWPAGTGVIGYGYGFEDIQDIAREFNGQIVSIFSKNIW